ncbi:MAG: hypothetical protein JNN09_01465 [Alphaproteobacteria bacterium]|nr:hypothetical protein [Alphaproteobacteria bacterium]
MQTAERPVGPIKAEICANRKDIFVFTIGYFLLFIAILLFLNSFAPYLFHFTFIVGAAALMTYVGNRWSTFRGTPYIRLYSNGLEFKGLGFWKWEEIVYHTTLQSKERERSTFSKNPLLRSYMSLFADFDKLEFFLDSIRGDMPRSWSISGCRYFHDKEKRVAQLSYRFPSGSSNIPMKEFLKKVDYQEELARNAPLSSSPIDENDPRLIKVIDFEGPSNKEAVEEFVRKKPRLIVWLLRGFCGFMVLLWLASSVAFLFSPNFFRSTEWASLVKPLSFVLSFLMVGIMVWMGALGKKGSRVAGLILYGVLFGLMFWMAFGLGLGYAYTKFMGEKETLIVKVEKKAPHIETSYYYRGGHTERLAHTIKIKPFDENMAVDVEVDPTSHAQMPQGKFLIEAYGYKSWFGRTYTTYSWPVGQKPEKRFLNFFDTVLE